MVLSFVGSLASCPRHKDVLEGFNFFKGRILVLSVSGGNVACAISCLPEELFGSSGLEPCPESDHSFSVLAEPVRRIAFHTKVDDAFDRASNRSAADRHLVPA